MPYTVTRQIQWPGGDKIVEISVGSGDFTNPDELVHKYPDEGRAFASPVEAVEAAIRICEAWRQGGAPDAQVGYGATYGMTMPFDASTFDEARAWARERLANLPKCDWCGEILPEHPYILWDDPDAGKFCREFCAEEVHQQTQLDLAELE